MALPAFTRQRRSAAMILAEKRRGATQTATQDRATLYPAEQLIQPAHKSQRTALKRTGKNTASLTTFS